MADINRLKQALSSIHHRWLFLPGESIPHSLTELLAQKFPDYPKESWPKRLDLGGAFINGKAAYLDSALEPPCCVEYFETRYDVLNAGDIFPGFIEEQIVFRDDDLAVVVKPYGLPCFQAREQRIYNFRKQLQDFFRMEVHMPSRLDTSVTGLVLVSLSEKMHDRLQKVFERRQVEKIYVLQSAEIVCWKEKIVDAPIDQDPRHPILRRVVETGGKSALTLFSRVETNEDRYSTLIASPKTGRTHQIRLHSAHIGAAIVGDKFYGGVDDFELRLASYAVRLNHPITGDILNITLPQQFQPEWLKAISAKLPIY